MPQVFRNTYRDNRIGISIGSLDRPRIGEAHTVEDRPVARQTAHCRRGVARLTLGGDGAHLDESEADGSKRLEPVHVLVESGSDAEGARKSLSQRMDGEFITAREGEPTEEAPCAGGGRNGAQRYGREGVRYPLGDALQDQLEDDSIDHGKGGEEVGVAANTARRRRIRSLAATRYGRGWHNLGKHSAYC